MTTVTHAYNQSGATDNEDQGTRIFLIDEENARRTAFNSTTPPPVAPLLILLKSSPAERKASVEAIISASLTSLWASYVAQWKEREASTANFKEIKDAFSTATPAQRTAGLAALKA